MEQEDEYEHYNYDQDKKMSSGKGGKQRSKKEVSEHAHHDQGGHTRKIAQNMVNQDENKKQPPAKK